MRIAPEDRGSLYANLLSLSRIPLAGLLWVAPTDPRWVLPIMFIAGLTDVLDGWVARQFRRHRHKEGAIDAFASRGGHGEVIDGVADKVFVVSTVGALALAVSPPTWLLVALLAREVSMLPVVVLYRLSPERLRRRVSFQAGFLGKAATIVQFAALVLGFVGHQGFAPAAVTAGGIGFASTAYYLIRAIRALRSAETEPDDNEAVS